MMQEIPQIKGKSDAETDRLTNIEASRLKKIRDADMTQAIEKINSKRTYQGERIVFKNDEEFAQAGMDILNKYDATESER